MFADKELLTPRIKIISGHYGSGKTEISLNLALALRQEVASVAIVDLDIVNLYFRSREYAPMLEQAGVQLYAGNIEGDSVDVPALSGAIRAPLQQSDTQTIIDLGGNPIGARVLGVYQQQLLDAGCAHYFVINANRPETATLEQVLAFMDDIARVAGIPITGLISNTHLLEETTAADIARGLALTEAVSAATHIPVRFVTCRATLCDELPENLNTNVLPLEIFMRRKWMNY